MTRALAVLLLAVALPAQAAVVTRGPYLQTNTPSSIIVRWRTDVATDSRVQIGAAPGALTTQIDDATVTTEHIVTVTGLTPYTKYFYSIGDTSTVLAGDDATHFFRTSPPPGTAGAYRFWLTGDGGFGTGVHAPNTMAVRDAYTAFQGGAETNLFILLGDNAYILGTDADYQAAFFNMHAALIRNTPAWPTFGNHEAFSSNSLTQTGPYFDMFSLPTAGEAGGVPSGTESYYSFDYGNIHFINLDGNSSPVTPGSAMMTWLEADLQATTADWVIAFWHHPPYSRGLLHNSDVEQREIDLRENVVPVLEDYGVDLVLCGHSHSYERSYLLDGHYDFASTFNDDMTVDSGDGAPGGDGAYRKERLGLDPHQGAVYVVAGSSSEVRPSTLNHPAHRVGHLLLGSLVLDVVGSTLTARFLTNTGAIADTFTIEKGPSCPPAPRSGCAASAAGKLVMKDFANDALDKLVWKWKRGPLDSGDLGAPDQQTDLAVCVYDATGHLVGGRVPRGADVSGVAAWRALASGVKYVDTAGAASGITKVKIVPGAGSGQILVKGKGTGLGMPPLPGTLPFTAQLVNLDNGVCWETPFAAAKRNLSGKVVALQ
ncbi:MAG TPA: metallophosphoesterase family protein [Candidatus Limnocylindria bacterium]|nr:metallophosphoesterase family protein [Candidatus Limnocylindria bacterium]